MQVGGGMACGRRDQGFSFACFEDAACGREDLRRIRTLQEVNLGTANAAYGICIAVCQNGIRNVRTLRGWSLTHGELGLAKGEGRGFESNSRTAVATTVARSAVLLQRDQIDCSIAAASRGGEVDREFEPLAE